MTYTIDCSKGVALSLAPATHVDEVIQGIFILLNTYIGEVPCFREFGIDPSYKDKPIPIAKANSNSERTFPSRKGLTMLLGMMVRI